MAFELRVFLFPLYVTLRFMGLFTFYLQKGKGKVNRAPQESTCGAHLTLPAPSLLGRCKQKQRGLRGLLCRWPSITEWEMYITARGPPSPK